MALVFLVISFSNSSIEGNSKLVSKLDITGTTFTFEAVANAL